MGGKMCIPRLVVKLLPEEFNSIQVLVAVVRHNGNISRFQLFCTFSSFTITQTLNGAHLQTS